MAKKTQAKIVSVQVAPAQPLTLSQIEVGVEQFLNEALTQTDPATLYVALKQAEAMIDKALTALKSQAAQAAMQAMGGSTRGEIMGHEIQLKTRSEWQYSRAVDELKEEQKQDLRIKQLEEQRDGKAKRIEFEPSISVTLRK